MRTSCFVISVEIHTDHKEDNHVVCVSVCVCVCARLCVCVCDFVCMHSQWRTEGGFGKFKPPPPEIHKALQNRAKLSPIVKTVKNF